jgi:oligopeptide/dipeptide ABC transporter ATP-binding protein
MRQRVLLAIALIRDPKLLIIDEPTTALDVITEGEVLDLVRGPIRASGAGILLITHNFGVVAETCDRVLVMYAGRIIESGPTQQVLSSPKHPYTKGLLESLPSTDARPDRLRIMPGSVPDPLTFPSGCRFHPRCPHRMAVCETEVPTMRQVGPDQAAACWLYELSDGIEAV